MKYSRTLIDKIKSFEGCRLTAYKCPSGVWTIGYGSTRMDGKPISEGMKITQDKADMLLAKDVDKVEQSMSRFVPSYITQNQWDALLDFSYNCGVSNLRKSTLLKKVKANANDPSIRAEFLKWNRGGGKVLDGLTKRRTWEAEHYYKKQ